MATWSGRYCVLNQGFWIGTANEHESKWKLICATQPGRIKYPEIMKYMYMEYVRMCHPLQVATETELPLWFPLISSNMHCTCRSASVFNEMSSIRIKEYRMEY